MLKKLKGCEGCARRRATLAKWRKTAAERMAIVAAKQKAQGNE